MRHPTHREEEEENEELRRLPLDWKDYIAITLAALQTGLLPFILLLIVLLLAAVMLGLFL